MMISYHESRPGQAGYGWDTDSLKEASCYVADDKKELVEDIRTIAEKLEKGDSRTVEYIVRITISK